MLSPEVWNFKPPTSNFWFEEGSSHTNSKIFENSCILNHYFNHSVSVVLPDTFVVPEVLTNSLSENCDYYKLSDVPVKQFIDTEFIDAFIKSGEVTMLSIDTNIDTDNCVAITPCGHLVLSLVRETYQELGLVGKPSILCRKIPSRYVVDIDLKDSSFVLGKKNYERVLKCLSEHIDQNMNFLIAWEPKDEKICPSSIAAYFSKKGYTVNLCSPKYASRKDYNVIVPDFSTDRAELLDWLGAFSLGVKLQKENSNDEYLSSYDVPHGSQCVGQVVLLHWQGFFTTKQIQRLLHQLRCYVEKRSELMWSSLHVEGFADTPVSWNLKEHCFHTNGDNHYTLFLQPNQNFIGCKVSTSCKLMK